MPVAIIFSVLPDSGYKFNHVLSDNTAFIANDSIRPYVHSVYWLKIAIANPTHFAGQYTI